MPIFQASSRVLIQDERTTQVVNLNANDPAFWQDADRSCRAQSASCRSRGLAQRLVKRLDLAHHRVFSSAGPRPRDPISLIRQARAAGSGWIESLISKPAAAAAAAAAKKKKGGAGGGGGRGSAMGRADPDLRR